MFNIQAIVINLGEVGNNRISYIFPSTDKLNYSLFICHIHKTNFALIAHYIFKAISTKFSLERLILNVSKKF